VCSNFLEWSFCLPDRDNDDYSVRKERKTTTCTAKQNELPVTSKKRRRNEIQEAKVHTLAESDSAVIPFGAWLDEPSLEEPRSKSHANSETWNENESHFLATVSSIHELEKFQITRNALCSAIQHCANQRICKCTLSHEHVNLTYVQLGRIRVSSGPSCIPCILFHHVMPNSVVRQEAV
jgi:hypothetical protein